MVLTLFFGYFERWSFNSRSRVWPICWHVFVGASMSQSELWLKFKILAFLKSFMSRSRSRCTRDLPISATFEAGLHTSTCIPSGLPGQGRRQSYVATSVRWALMANAHKIGGRLLLDFGMLRPSQDVNAQQAIVFATTTNSSSDRK